MLKKRIFAILAKKLTVFCFMGKYYEIKKLSQSFFDDYPLDQLFPGLERVEFYIQYESDYPEEHWISCGNESHLEQERGADYNSEQ